ncbi:MAG: RNA polymerase sigma factor [Chloroflexota bacterium]|nr:RNA polymerase sigma factor [Chloroflexota bacterium]
MSSAAVEGLLRDAAPRVLATLVRRHGRFDACEDAVQEALLAAAVQWPERGIPDNPNGWLVTVASRRLIDQLSSDDSRRRREVAVTLSAPPGGVEIPDEDDTLMLLLLCCHPALTQASQVALTLRAVGGLTTAEIARAFLVPESTMAQRISRAKQGILRAGARFELPPASDRGPRLASVLHVVYLIFNEGYAATSGSQVTRADLTAEAIRIARLVRDLLPQDGEVTGLLALMLLTEGRRPARTAPDGTPVPLAEQDRSRWDRALIDEGLALVTAALTSSPLGPYQLQAAIAAVHSEAARAEATDWAQIVALYELLERISPSPVVRLNRCVAVAMVHGPAAGLALLATVERGDHMAEHHRVAAVRAHLQDLAGDLGAAEASFLDAARSSTSLPERRYLEGRAARLKGARTSLDRTAPRSIRKRSERPYER